MDEAADFDFDLDRSTDQAWSGFAERLAEVISVIDDGGVLTIGTPATGEDQAPFVRFTQHESAAGDPHPDAAVGEAMVLAEASGSASLAEAYQLSGAQLEELDALGWQSPAADGPRPCANFWVDRGQDRSDELAELAVRTLRSVFGVQHPVFLAPDQLAEILQPGSPAPHETPAGPVTVPAVMPLSRSRLDEMVAAELTEMFGHPPVCDAEGDFAIRVGSTMVFIRSTPDAEELLLFSAIVHDVEGRSRAVEVLNDLNVASRYGRFALHQDRVFVTMSLMCRPFVAEHLRQGVRIMSELADGIDDELARKLRGRTTFESPDTGNAG